MKNEDKVEVCEWWEGGITVRKTINGVDVSVVDLTMPNTIFTPFSIMITPKYELITI